MRMTFEGSNDEMCKLFDVSSMKHLFTNQDRLEINLGKSIYSCYINNATELLGSAGWSFIIELQGYDKKEEDIRKAKALVNSTKEAHKEAQRKLAELMEEKL